jgi:hypothetical protein
VARWLKENRHKATADEDVSKLRWLGRYLRDKDLPAIDRNVIDLVTKEKLAGAWTNATVNRTLELFRAVLRKCVNEWEWLDRAPFVRMLKEPTRRIRFLTREEAAGSRPRWCVGMRISRRITWRPMRIVSVPYQCLMRDGNCAGIWNSQHNPQFRWLKIIRKLLILLVAGAGFEPATFGL